MSGEVRQAEPPDEELGEYWERLPGEEMYLLGVEAMAGDGIDGWHVTIWAGQYFRQDPMGVELRQRIQSALRAVPGVSKVAELRWETWEVSGTPSGEALTRAAASVVDELADRMRVAYEAMS
jgi:hypothetical protein